MISYESRVVIDRPADAVYAALTDPERFPEWTDMVDVRFDGGPPHVGDRGQFRLASGPIKGDLAIEVIDVEPERRIVYRIDHPWLSWRAISELTPSGGGTELRYAGEVRLRGLRRLLEPFVAGEIRAGERTEAERLKVLLEVAPQDVVGH